MTGRADRGHAERIAAVVFDLDGVLIDSEPVWEQVRHGLVDKRGGTWPATAQARLIGMSTAEWARYLSDDLGVGLPPDRVASIVIDKMTARYAERLPVLPGADQAVRSMAARWRVGLASSSPRRLIDAATSTAGWDAVFEVTLSTDEAGRGKPAPDVYQQVAARLGLSPSACAAVEDSSNGLRSAAAAGMRVVAVPRPRYPPDPDALELAALTLTSLAGLTVAAVEGLAGR
jgi:HAD superfamily hydrolase (TIGR01509 family)